MSVLFAQFVRDGGPVERAGIESVLDGTAHRHDDGLDLWIQHPVALAARHFWVTPEQVGERLPVSRGPLHLVVDARLDNRDELLNLLPAAPAATDAELLLRAFERWGEETPERLLGDFAYIAWNADRQELSMARDALGARGLCYFASDRQVLVASDLATLLAHPDVPAGLYRNKILDVLLDAWDEHETTLFENVFYCPPGSVLRFGRTDRAKRRYWRLQPGARLHFRDDREYAERFREVATRAVRSRLRTDDPVGLSLSGGLDSSTVAALAAEYAPSLRTYSYVFDTEPACDERRFIERTADRLGLVTTFLPGEALGPLRQDPKTLPTVPGFLVSDPYAVLALAVVDAAAADGCRVLLTGHFGDHLFLGGVYWGAELLRSRRRRDLARFLVHNRKAIAPRRDLLSHGLLQLVPGARWTRRRRPLPRILEALDPVFATREKVLHHRRRDTSWRVYDGPGEWARVRALTGAAACQGAMAVRGLFHRRGIERLDPLADRRLVELAFALPADQLGGPGETRPVLRRAMAGRLPESVRRRPDKTDFSPLFLRGMEENVRYLDRLFRAPRVVTGQFIRPDWLRRQLAGRWREDRGYTLWKVVGLELWLRSLECPAP